ncbi:MAG: hypothetical protein IKJ93_06500 [Clostridia bacterium]|nr:hypothetical protein [Clostridia bacterium]
MKKKLMVLSLALLMLLCFCGCKSAPDNFSVESLVVDTGETANDEIESAVVNSESEITNSDTTNSNAVDSNTTTSITTNSQVTSSQSVTSNENSTKPKYETVDLDTTPVATDKIYKCDGKLTINFQLSQSGYFSLLAYDATDYVDDIEEYPIPKVTFYDGKGKVLYKDVSIENGFMKKHLFKKGTLTAEITFKGNTKKMKQAGLYWAFGADSEKAVALKEGKSFATKAGRDGESRFTFEAKQSGLYRFTCAEGAVWESDCSFEVINAKKKSVAGSLMIHGTEWTSRSVFLQKGSYDVVVSGIQKVATCKVELTDSVKKLTIAGSDTAKAPTTIGFSNELPQSQKATFEVKNKTKLWVNASGSNAYYDSEQPFTMVVTDESGKIIAEEDAEGFAVVKLKGLSGKITVEISDVGNGIVSLTLE